MDTNEYYEALRQLRLKYHDAGEEGVYLMVAEMRELLKQYDGVPSNKGERQ